MRPLLPIAATVVGVLLLSGCAGLSGGLPEYSGTVTDSQLPGTWTGNCQAKIVLRSDHSLTITDFPMDADGAGDAIGTRASGNGTWDIFPRVSHDTPATLHITAGTVQTHLDFAAGDGASLALAVTIGDPDNGVGCIFTRTA